MRALVIGASGAIGQCVYQTIKTLNKFELIYTPTSSELKLGSGKITKYLEKLNTVDFLLLAFGTYGGLKFYEEQNLKKQSNAYWSDLDELLRHEVCKNAYVLNFSSAVLENKNNQKLSSRYFQYAKEKKELEKIIQCKSSKYIFLRPTNILSCTENHKRSGHAISSLYRVMAGKTLNEKCEVWTNPKDWREFTTSELLSVVIKALMSNPQNYVSQTIAFGTGVKSSMEAIVSIFANEFNIDLSDVIFTQKHKAGPLDEIIGCTHIHDLERYNFDVEGSLKNVIKTWKIKDGLDE